MATMEHSGAWFGRTRPSASGAIVAASPALIGVWLIGSALLVGQTWLWGWLQGVDKGFWACLFVSLPYVATWSAMIPVVASLAGRIPLEPDSWRAGLLVHVGAALGLASIATLLHAPLALMFGWVSSWSEARALLGLTVPLKLPLWIGLYALATLAAWRAQPEATDRRTVDAGSRRLVVPAEDGKRFVDVDDIDWLEADRNYVIVHTPHGDERIRETLAGLTERLPDRFFRIHRSRVVNLERVESVRRWRNGDFVVVLEDGTRLPLSRTYRASFEEHLGARL